MMNEIRTTLQPVELRAEGDRLVAVGLGIAYGRRSHDLGGFVEQSADGAARKTILEADIRALVEHDPKLLLGRTGSGTVRLEEREDGVHYEIDLPDTTLGRDTAMLLDRGDYAGSSYGFRALSDEWTETEDGRPLRILTEVAVRDIGPVAFPAYPDTTSGLQSLAAQRSLPIEEVRALADEGNLIEAVRFVPSVEDVEVPVQATPARRIPRRY